MTVKIRKDTAQARIKAAGDKGLTRIREDIIEDMNEFAPVGGGAARNGGGGSLQDSARLNSDQQARDGKLMVRYTKPYARYQWGGLVMHGTPKNRTYGPERLKYTSSVARSEWAKHAAQVYGEKWAEMQEKAMHQYL